MHHHKVLLGHQARTSKYPQINHANDAAQRCAECSLLVRTRFINHDDLIHIEDGSCAGNLPSHGCGQLRRLSIVNSSCRHRYGDCTVLRTDASTCVICSPTDGQESS